LGNAEKGKRKGKLLTKGEKEKEEKGRGKECVYILGPQVWQGPRKEEPSSDGFVTFRWVRGKEGEIDIKSTKGERGGKWSSYTSGLGEERPKRKQRHEKTLHA